MFLKLKTNGMIKGRAVAGENKKIYFISKEGACSLTVATEAVLLSCVIDAQEHRDIAAINNLNAFIKICVEKIEDMANIIVRGALVDVLVGIAPDIYGPYVSTYKKGVRTLILGCHNSYYRTMV